MPPLPDSEPMLTDSKPPDSAPVIAMSTALVPLLMIVAPAALPQPANSTTPPSSLVMRAVPAVPAPWNMAMPPSPRVIDAVPAVPVPIMASIAWLEIEMSDPSAVEPAPTRMATSA